MKKIIFVIIVLLAFIGINWHVNATNQNISTLYVEVNCGNDEILEVQNCTIVQNKVEWNRIGTYEVVYYHNISKQYIIREVNVELLDTFKNGYFDNEVVQEFSKVNKYKIEKVLIDSKTSLYVMGTIMTDNPDVTFGIIEYYKDNLLQWKYLYSDTIYTTIADAVLTKLGLLVAFNYYPSPEQSDIVLVELNNKGKVIQEKMYYGKYIDSAIQLYLDNDYIYLIAATESVDGDYKAFKESEYLQIIVLKITYYQLEIVLGKVIANDKNSLLWDASFSGDYIYLFTTIIGENGTISSGNKDYSGNVLIKLDYNLKIQRYQFIDCSNKNFLGMYCFDDEIGLIFNYLTIDQNIVIQMYNSSLQQIRQVISLYSLKEYNLKKVLAVKLSTESKVFVIQSYKNGLQVHGGYLIVRGVNSKIIESSQPLCTNVFFNNYDQETYVINYQDNLLKVVKEKLIYCEEKIVASKEYEEQAYDVYVNGMLCNENKFNQTSYDNFGIYHELYCYSYDFFDIYLQSKKEVFVNSNVNNNQVYSRGIRLNFNSKNAYLNNQKISTGYKINNSGEYVLKLYGNNDDIYIYNFVVADITTPFEFTEEGFDLQDVILKEVKNNKDINNTERQFTNDYTDSLTYATKDNVSIYISIIILLITVSIIIYIPKKKVKK